MVQIIKGMFNFFKFLCETYVCISLSARLMMSAAFTVADAKKKEWPGKGKRVVLKKLRINKGTESGGYSSIPHIAGLGAAQRYILWDGRYGFLISDLLIHA